VLHLTKNCFLELSPVACPVFGCDSKFSPLFVAQNLGTGRKQFETALAERAASVLNLEAFKPLFMQQSSAHISFSLKDQLMQQLAD